MLDSKKSIARLYKRLPQNRVRCKLCPRGCTLKEGQKGFCLTRQNVGGDLHTLVYGKVVRIAQEFMETEGVFHFAPNAPILSIGNMGCNLHCKFCQNWKTSQMRFIDENDYKRVTPEQIVEMALTKNIHVLSWTYNDPVVWHEFVMDTARLARKNGLLNLYKSAFYLTLDAVKELCEVIDIFSISLKSFRDDFYQKHATATVEPILENIKYVYQTGIHLELSNLMVTDLNDSEEDARGVIKWHLENTSPDVPLHFVRFHPAYLYKDVPRTPIERLEHARKIALDMGVKYCYIGNVYENEGGNTYCPECRHLLINRFDINTKIVGLTNNGECNNCGYQTHIIANPFENVMKKTEDDHFKHLSKEIYRWSEEINRVHIEASNTDTHEADVNIYRLGLDGKSSSSTRKTRILPEENYSFIISKSSLEETGIVICYPSYIKIRISELLDRAHLPTEYKEKKSIHEMEKLNFKSRISKFVHYEHSIPSWITRRINFPLYVRMKGLKILDFLKELETSQIVDQEQLRRIQLKKLQTLLTHSYNYVPHYRKVFRSLNFLPESVDDIQAIKRLPILEKFDFFQNNEDFRTHGKSIPFFKARTTGSTGIPLSMVTDYNSVSYNIASRIRSERWWGLNYGLREVHFWGRGFRKPNLSLRLSDRLIRNKIVLSTLNMTDEIKYDYYKKLIRFNPEIIYGNPSAIYIFSRFLVENDLDISNLKTKAVISTTEILHEYQREFIQLIFHCPVINEYGATEAGIIAYECPHHNMHLNAENLIVEIIKRDGQDAELNEFGDIVITNLNNQIMPIIRYKIGDVGRLIPGECPCGIRLPLLDITIARDCDTIILEDKELPGAVLFGGLGKELISFTNGGLESYKIYQKDLDTFLFQAVLKNPKLQNRLEQRTKEVMTEYLGPKISVGFEYVDSIPRDKSGKLRYFVSEVLN